MSCTKPLIRAETHETYRNKKGGISYKAEFLPRTLYDEIMTDHSKSKLIPSVYRKIDLIGCGQCIECRLQYTREWATRCMLEKQYGKDLTPWYKEDDPDKQYGAYNENECWFLTLTYADEYLPSRTILDEDGVVVAKGISIEPKDMQDFWKRVRKRYGSRKLKYLNVSEYGHQTQRPHNHAIVFGLPLNEMLFQKMGNNDWGDPYWRTPELETLWPLGHVTIGRVTWKSCAYVARYNLKKILAEQDNQWYALQGKLPEHVSMSDNIGMQYFKDHKEQIMKTDSVPVINPKSGELTKPPRSFDRLIKEVDEDIYKMIKDKRRMVAESGEYMKRSQTDLTPEERRIQAHQRMKDTIKDLRKGD